MTDSIPPALRERDQWVLWKAENNTKVPYRVTGSRASTTDPASWSSYDRVRAVEARGGYSGVGFVFSPDDPFAGIDLDDCVTGETVEEWAHHIVAEAASYAEISPSLTGIKIWVIGSIPTSVKTKEIELYDRARFFTVTSRRLSDAPLDVVPAQSTLDRLYARLRPPEDPPATPSPVRVIPTDDYLKEWATRTIAQEVVRVMNAPQGEKHNTRFDAARLLGGLIPLGLASADEIEAALYAAQIPASAAAHAERKTIRDGIANGALTPLALPDPPQQPLMDEDGYACCPTHQTRLIPAKNGNGWRCSEYDCYWWKGEGYTKTVQGKIGAFEVLIGGKTKPAAPIITDWLDQGIKAVDLQARTFAHVNWPVANILSEGCTLLAGKPKSKKSWLALGLAVDVAAGQQTLGGLDTKQSRVLYLDLESNQRRMQSRLRAILGTSPWPDNLHIFTEWPRGEQGIAQLEAFLAHYSDTGLIIADILQNIRPARVKNGNPYDEDYEAVKPLNQLGERHHAAVLALHHTRKAKADDVFDEISGSTGLSAGVAAMWVLGRLPNGPESVLAVRGRDIVIDDDMALEWDEYACRFMWVGSAEQRSLSQERRAVLDIMADGEQYTPKELAQTLGKPANAIKPLLLHLFNDRFLDKTGYGKYTKVQGKHFPGSRNDNSDNGSNSDNSGNSGNSVRISDRETIKEVSNLDTDPINFDYRVTTSPQELPGGGNSLLTHQEASNTASNGKSYQSYHFLTESAIDHDHQREQEAMLALAKHDYRAARRAAMQIRGRKSQLRVEELIDETQQKQPLQKDTNGGTGTTDG